MAAVGIGLVVVAGPAGIADDALIEGSVAMEDGAAVGGELADDAVDEVVSKRATGIVEDIDTERSQLSKESLDARIESHVDSIVDEADTASITTAPDGDIAEGTDRIDKPAKAKTIVEKMRLFMKRKPVKAHKGFGHPLLQQMYADAQARSTGDRFLDSFLHQYEVGGFGGRRFALREYEQMEMEGVDPFTKYGFKVPDRLG